MDINLDIMDINVHSMSTLTHTYFRGFNEHNGQMDIMDIDFTTFFSTLNGHSGHYKIHFYLYLRIV